MKLCNAKLNICNITFVGTQLYVVGNAVVHRS